MGTLLQFSDIDMNGCALTNVGAMDSTVARVFTIATHASTASIAITHGLGKQWVVARIYITATGEEIECDVVATSTTVTTFGFGTAPGANTLTFVIIG